MKTVSNRKENMNKRITSRIVQQEIIRVLVFLGLLTIYFTSNFGKTIRVLHFLLILLNPKVFGMSRVVNKVHFLIFK